MLSSSKVVRGGPMDQQIWEETSRDRGSHNLALQFRDHRADGHGLPGRSALYAVTVSRSWSKESWRVWRWS